MNSGSKFNKKDDVDLVSALEPVSKELKALERKLLESLSNNNSYINSLAEYIIKSGGKKLRPAICFLISKALNKGYVSSGHFRVGQAVELTHLASLIHDDVIDENKKRRNEKTINYKWNNKTAVIAGDFLISKALINLALIKNHSVVEIFANAISQICEGELNQSLQKFKIISTSEYIDKSKKKTADLFVAGAKSVAILTPNADNSIVNDVKEYALNLGIAFQAVDDILDYTGDEKILGKPVATDLKNGIITYPALFAIKQYAEAGDYTLETLIKNRLRNQNDLDKALKLILESNGVEQTKKLAVYFSDLALKSLSNIEESVYKLSLQALTRYILKRSD